MEGLLSRDSRLTNELGDRVGTDQRLLREVDGRWNSSDPLQYSDTYGTTMTKVQETGLSAKQAEFNTQVDAANKSLGETGAKVENLYTIDKERLSGIISGLPTTYADWYGAKREVVASGLDKSTFQYIDEEGNTHFNQADYDATIDNLLSEYTDIGDGTWSSPLPYKKNPLDVEYKNTLLSNPRFADFYQSYAKNNLVTVYTDDARGNRGVYYVEPSYAAQLAAIDLQGYGSAGYNNDGSVSVGSDTYMHKILPGLEEYDAYLTKALSEAYISGTRTSSEEQLSNLETQYGLAKTSLSNEQRKVAGAVEENTLALGTIRSKYAAKLENMRETIGAMNIG